MTATDALNSAPRGRDWRLPRRARASPLRELRSGLSGFRIFIACVALGVTVITGVGAVSDALRAGFERQGEAILGGDADAVAHARARRGRGARRARRTSGASARRRPCAPWRGAPTASDQALAELKGVDAAYPLVGTVELAGGGPLQEALRAAPSSIRRCSSG